MVQHHGAVLLCTATLRDMAARWCITKLLLNVAGYALQRGELSVFYHGASHSATLRCVTEVKRHGAAVWQCTVSTVTRQRECAVQVWDFFDCPIEGFKWSDYLHQSALECVMVCTLTGRYAITTFCKSKNLCAIPRYRVEYFSPEVKAFKRASELKRRL